MSTSAVTITPATKITCQSPIADRINARSVKNPITGCVIWQGSLSTQGKYPTIGVLHADGSRTIEYAYRAIWEAVNGPIPTTKPEDGSFRWEAHHRCRSRICVNPDHIELTTQKRHSREHAEIRRAEKAARNIRKVA